jgi:ABC-type sugar transport system ATPase subunit
MEGISKSFGGVQALRGVDFEAVAGEVHAVCGENGAGKSTLMKILAGVLGGYEGRVLLEGRPVRFTGPREAEDAGIRIIHQELNLVPHLTVAANLFLGRERRKGLFLDDRAMEAAAERMFGELGTPIDPRARVGSLRIGDQQMVEIAKALLFDAAVLIMDEPTSALSDAEVARLFRVIADLRARGTTVLYISHKMNEVFTIADRVTVLRDGRLVARARREEVERAQVVRWMVGREIAAFEFEKSGELGPPLLELRGLTQRATGPGRPALSGIDLTLRAGEVLGVAGLLGAGRTELLEALFGAVPVASGEIRLKGQVVRFRSPRDAIRAGIALVTEDRKALGLFPDLTVRENITLVELRRLAGLGGVVRRGAERRAVETAIGRLGIKTDGPEAPVTSLSGGNQQKCVIARWLLTEPLVLLLDEPTRGIDVGAKAEIYALMRRLAGQGMGIVMTSSELPELLAVCDRIAVLCEGRLTAVLDRGEATEERIMEAATRFLDRASA